MEKPEELKRKAEKALDKKSLYGPDIDLEEYDFGEPGPVKNKPLSELGEEVLKRAGEVGVDVEEHRVSGTFFQVDHEVLRSIVIDRLRKQGVLVMSAMEALKKLDWVKKYYWKAIPVDLDKFTAAAELYWRHGYFIYVPPGVKVKQPVQACLFVCSRDIAQPVHNIIIADENSELNLVTACSTLANRGLHIGISEFYVGRNAKITFTMVHGWASNYHVRPRAVAVVEEGGTFVNYYINLHPVKTLQMYPTAILNKKAQGFLTSILLAREKSMMDVGGRIVLKGEGAKGEITSRSVIKDESTAVMRGELVGEVPGVKAHLECRGLLLSEKAHGEAIPTLKSFTEGAELTHEAALGRISEEELLYLMTKGFNEDEATSLIVRGFVEIGLDKLPETIRKPVLSILELVSRLAKG